MRSIRNVITDGGVLRALVTAVVVSPNEFINPESFEEAWSPTKFINNGRQRIPNSSTSRCMGHPDDGKGPEYRHLEKRQNLFFVPCLAVLRWRIFC